MKKPTKKPQPVNTSPSELDYLRQEVERLKNPVMMNQRQPSELEVTAQKVHENIVAIEHLRNRIKSVGREFQELQNSLVVERLNHQVNLREHEKLSQERVVLD